MLGIDLAVGQLHHPPFHVSASSQVAGRLDFTSKFAVVFLLYIIFISSLFHSNEQDFMNRTAFV